MGDLAGSKRKPHPRPVDGSILPNLPNVFFRYPVFLTAILFEFATLLAYFSFSFSEKGLRRKLLVCFWIFDVCLPDFANIRVMF